MIGSPDGVSLWFVESDVISQGTSLIGSFKAIQQCLMIGWTRPKPQSLWLVVIYAREWSIPKRAPVFDAKGVSHLFLLFSRMEFTCRLLVGSRLLPAFRVGPHKYTLWRGIYMNESSLWMKDFVPRLTQKKWRIFFLKFWLFLFQVNQQIFHWLEKAFITFKGKSQTIWATKVLQYFLLAQLCSLFLS